MHLILSFGTESVFHFGSVLMKPSMSWSILEYSGVDFLVATTSKFLHSLAEFDTLDAFRKILLCRVSAGLDQFEVRLEVQIFNRLLVGTDLYRYNPMHEQFSLDTETREEQTAAEECRSKSPLDTQMSMPRCGRNVEQIR